MVSDDPRCPFCRNDVQTLLEKVSRPICASRGMSLYFCQVCSRLFEFYKKEPSPSI